MSSSAPEQLAEPSYRTVDHPDLRGGVWTRLGDSSVLGDQTTETVLGTLAERTRSAARAQGYAVGWSEGHQAGMRRAATEAEAMRAELAQREEQRAAEHAAAVAGLVTAARALQQASAGVTAQIADQATELAFELTRVLVGHELAASAEPGAGVVARVLAVLPDDAGVRVHLHPQTAAEVAGGELAELGVAVRPDPALARHDALVETDTTAIDLRVEAALERLRGALPGTSVDAP